jgi:hypothetical protein
MVKLATRIKSKTYTSSSTSKIYYWESLFLSKTPFLWCIGCRKLLEIPITTTRLKKPFIGTVHLNTKRSFFDSEVSWLKKNSSFINYELHPIEVVSKETFHIAPWVKNIPGVGKMDDPWEYLKYRLLAIKALGDIKLLYQVKIDEY